MTYYLFDSIGELPQFGSEFDIAFVADQLKQKIFINTSSAVSNSHFFSNGRYDFDPTKTKDILQNDKFIIDYYFNAANANEPIFSIIDSNNVEYDLTDQSLNAYDITITDNTKVLYNSPDFINLQKRTSVFLDGKRGGLITKPYANFDSSFNSNSYEFWSYNSWIDTNKDKNLLLFSQKDANGNTLVSYKKYKNDTILTINNVDFTVNDNVQSPNIWEHTLISYDKINRTLLVNGVEESCIPDPDYVKTDGDLTYISDYSIAKDAAFECKAIFPSQQTDCTLFEVGTVENNTRLRLDGLGNLILSVGLRPDTINYEIEVSTTNFPTDGQEHLIAWDIRINPGRARLFIDGDLVGEQNISTELAEGSWASKSSFRNRSLIDNIQQYTDYTIGDYWSYAYKNNIPEPFNLKYQRNVVFKFETTFPPNWERGVLFSGLPHYLWNSFGDATVGTYIAIIDDNGTKKLLSRIYNSNLYLGSAVDYIEHYDISVPVSSLPQDGQSHSIVLEYMPGKRNASIDVNTLNTTIDQNGWIRLFIDGQLQGYDYIPTNSPCSNYWHSDNTHYISHSKPGPSFRGYDWNWISSQAAYYAGEIGGREEVMIPWEGEVSSVGVYVDSDRTEREQEPELYNPADYLIDRIRTDTYYPSRHYNSGVFNQVLVLLDSDGNNLFDDENIRNDITVDQSYEWVQYGNPNFTRQDDILGDATNYGFNLGNSFYALRMYKSGYDFVGDITFTNPVRVKYMFHTSQWAGGMNSVVGFYTELYTSDPAAQGQISRWSYRRQAADGDNWNVPWGTGPLNTYRHFNMRNVSALDASVPKNLVHRSIIDENYLPNGSATIPNNDYLQYRMFGDNLTQPNNIITQSNKEVIIDFGGNQYNMNSLYYDGDQYGRWPYLIKTDNPIMPSSSNNQFYFEITVEANNKASTSIPNTLRLFLCLITEEAFNANLGVESVNRKDQLGIYLGKDGYLKEFQQLYDRSLQKGDVLSVLVDEADQSVTFYWNGSYAGRPSYKNLPDKEYYIAISDMEYINAQGLERSVKINFDVATQVYSPDYLLTKNNTAGAPNGGFGFGLLGNYDSWQDSITGDLIYYPNVNFDSISDNTLNIGADILSLNFEERGSDYAIDYVTNQSGKGLNSILNYTGDSDLTNTLTNMPNGAVLMLPEGRYKVTLYEDSYSATGISRHAETLFKGNNFLLCGATDNPNNVVIDLDYDSNYRNNLFYFPLFGYGDDDLSQYAYLKVNRYPDPNFKPNGYKVCNSVYANGGKAYRTIFDNNSENLIFYYQSPYFTQQINYDQCIFTNYSTLNASPYGKGDEAVLTNCYLSDKTSASANSYSGVVTVNTKDDAYSDSNYVYHGVYNGFIQGFELHNIGLAESGYTVDSSIPTVDSSTELLVSAGVDSLILLSHNTNGDLLINNNQIPTNTELDTWEYIRLTYDSGVITVDHNDSTIHSEQINFNFDSAQLYIGGGLSLNNVTGNYTVENLNGYIKAFRIKTSNIDSVSRPLEQYQGDQNDDLIVAANDIDIPGSSLLTKVGTVTKSSFSPFSADAYRWFDVETYYPINGVIVDSSGRNPTTKVLNRPSWNTAAPLIFDSAEYDQDSALGVVVSLRKYDEENNEILWKYEDFQNYSQLVDIGDDSINKNYLIRLLSGQDQSMMTGREAVIQFEGYIDSNIYPVITLDEYTVLEDNIRISVICNRYQTTISNFNFPGAIQYVNMEYLPLSGLNVNDFDFDSYYEEPLIGV